MRTPAAELMDDPTLDWAANRRALRDLDRVNRLLLGFGAATRTVVPRILRAGGTGATRQTLLDVGTGSGLASARIAAAVAARGVSLRVVGIDRKLKHLLLGRAFGIHQARVVADASALPFKDGACDWSLSTLLWHHLDRAGNECVLGELRRTARIGAIVVDLRRSRIASVLARVLLPAIGAGHVARHDGFVSLGQAWPLAAVREVVCGLPSAEVRRRFPFRFSLVAPPMQQTSPPAAPS